MYFHLKFTKNDFRNRFIEKDEQNTLFFMNIPLDLILTWKIYMVYKKV